jgi:hypothetical protein
MATKRSPHLMRVNRFLVVTLAGAWAALAALPANAQATRTWVSGVGDDVNPCSRTAPCKTFAGAISKTAVGGEINALDPGGFGAVTITKSITIDGGGGHSASVLAAGTNGIVINSAGAVVTLRNLQINGVRQSPTPGLNGVQFLAGAALHIENCAIFGFSQNAININLSAATASHVFVTDTVARNSAVGINARTTGSGKGSVSVVRSTLVQNSSFGMRVEGTGGPGIIIGSISDSKIAGNGTGLSAISGATASVGIRLTRSSLVNNVGAGAVSNGSAGQPVNIVFADNIITGNSPGLSSVGGGFLSTLQNNNVVGNFPDGAFTTTLNPQ